LALAPARCRRSRLGLVHAPSLHRGDPGYRWPKRRRPVLAARHPHHVHGTDTPKAAAQLYATAAIVVSWLLAHGPQVDVALDLLILTETFVFMASLLHPESANRRAPMNSLTQATADGPQPAIEKMVLHSQCPLLHQQRSPASRAPRRP
jgi:hypothetical protein